MSNRNNGRIHFSPNVTPSSRGKYDYRDYPGDRIRSRGKSGSIVDRIVRNQLDDPEDHITMSYIGDDDYTLADLKALRKKKSIKNILKGKVLNTSRKKYKRWKKNDKEILDEILLPSIQALYDEGTIGHRRAKKLHKQVRRRILNCFYGKEKKDK